MLLGACRKQQTSAPPPAPPVTITHGILDHSRWSKWVQGSPRIILVSSLDIPTNKLIATQTRIFTALLTPDPDPAPLATGDVQAQLDAVKNSFPAKGQTHPGYLARPIEVPHHERWDSYRRTVAHATLTNLPGLIKQLEAKIAGDIRELEVQLNSHGLSGAQARADTAWLDGSMTNVLERMKKIGKSSFVSPSSPAEKARDEWVRFEATELPLIKQVIDANTLAEAPVNSDGSFSVNGQGLPVAVIQVAGRQLYFPLQQPGELRFLNVKTSTR